MIFLGQRSLPLSVPDLSSRSPTRAFKHELFHINWLRRILRRISSSLFEQYNRATHSFLGPSEQSLFTSSLAASAPLPWFAVFLHCVAVLCVVVMSHPQAIPFGHRCTVGVNRDLCWRMKAIPFELRPFCRLGRMTAFRQARWWGPGDRGRRHHQEAWLPGPLPSTSPRKLR